jgi:GNAT superfamily N-acetyltransferase
MSNENVSWTGVSSNFEQPDEEYFREWGFFEQKFNEFGDPGFSEQTLPVRFPGIIGHNDDTDVRFTLYRGEDGALLFVHGCYLDKNDNNIQKPFIWHCHPDHQRQGLGTMMANYVVERFKKENNTDFNYEKSLTDTIYNTASANFANKFVNNIYNQ